MPPPVAAGERRSRRTRGDNAAAPDAAPDALAHAHSVDGIATHPSAAALDSHAAAAAAAEDEDSDWSREGRPQIIKREGDWLIVALPGGLEIKISSAAPVERSGKGFLVDAEEAIADLGLDQSSSSESEDEGDPGEGDDDDDDDEVSQDGSSTTSADVSASDEEQGSSDSEGGGGGRRRGVVLAPVLERPWKRQTQLTSVSNPSKIKVFETATLASEFLQVHQSKVAVLRGKGVPCNGWLISDVLPKGQSAAAAAAAAKQSDGKAGGAAGDKGKGPASKPRPRRHEVFVEPVKLRPVSDTNSSTSRTRPVVLTSCVDPWKTKAYSSSTFAAKALDVDERIISKRRGQPRTCKGWYISDVGEIHPAVKSLRRKLARAKRRGSGGGRRLHRPVRLVREGNPSVFRDFRNKTEAQEFLRIRKHSGRWNDIKRSKKAVNGWLISSKTPPHPGSALASGSANGKRKAGDDDDDDDSDDDGVDGDEARRARREDKKPRHDKGLVGKGKAGKEKHRPPPPPPPPKAPTPPPPRTPSPPPPSAFDEFAELAKRATNGKWPVAKGANAAAATARGKDVKFEQSFAGGRDLAAVLAGHSQALVAAEAEQPDEDTPSSVSLPPTLAGVPGHSGRLYSGPQNRRGRNRDFLVVKRSAGPPGQGEDGESGRVPPLREVDAGTWYDVTAMEKENYLVRDLDSEDGYHYMGKILGLIDVSNAGADGFRYLAYVMWPAFPDCDPVWAPYRPENMVQFSALESEGFKCAEPDLSMPRIGWAYQRTSGAADAGAARRGGKRRAAK